MLNACLQSRGDFNGCRPALARCSRIAARVCLIVQAYSQDASIALHCRVWPHRMVPGSRSLLDLRPAPVDLRRELRLAQSLKCSEQQNVRARTGVHQ